MKRRFSSAVVTLLSLGATTLGGVPAQAGDFACIRAAYEDMIKTAAKKGYLNEADRREIERVLQSEAPLVWRMDRIVRIMADARIQSLNGRELGKFSLVQVVVGESQRPGEVNGFQLNLELAPFRLPNVPAYAPAIIKVLIPPRYHGTMVEAIIKIHEYEHAISELQSTRKFRKFDVRKLSDAEKAYHRYQDEISSMLLEYEFMRALPEADRRAMLTEVRKDFELKGREREFLIHLLEESFVETPGEYLAAQFEWGRYSLKRIKERLGDVSPERIRQMRQDLFDSKDSRQHTTLGPGRPLFATYGSIGPTLAGAALLGVCQYMKSHSKYQESQLNRVLCGRLWESRQMPR